MAKNCANHKDVASIGTCAQCGKALCQQCVMITPAGQFCSTQCSTVSKEMKKLGGDKKKGSPALKFVFVVLLVVAAAFGVHFAAASKSADSGHWLKKIDVIGRFIDQDKK